MKLKQIIIAILVVIIGISIYFLFKSPNIKNYPPKNQTIVAFGDSLVQGIGGTEGNDFVSLLSEKTGRPIVNLGVSGNTTAQGLERIDEVISKDPGTVIVLLGGNDYLRKLPQKETFNNLRNIIITLQSKGIMVVLLGVRGGLLVDKFNSDFKSLAKETGVVFVPNVLDGLIGDSRYMTSDGIHPNNLGYQKIAEKVYTGIYKYIKP